MARPRGSLTIDPPPSYHSYELWAACTAACRELAHRATVDMRTLDRALWQYSAEHQPAGGTS